MWSFDAPPHHGSFGGVAFDAFSIALIFSYGSVVQFPLGRREGVTLQPLVVALDDYQRQSKFA
jgi:hypothetical protein